MVQFGTGRCATPLILSPVDATSQQPRRVPSFALLSTPFFRQNELRRTAFARNLSGRELDLASVGT
jgi:hypothetical protein